MVLLKTASIFTGVLCCLALCFGGQSAAPQPPAHPRTMALTFDDLPYVEVDERHDLAAAQRGTASILQALTARKAPAVAFVSRTRCIFGIPKRTPATLKLRRLKSKKS